MKSDPVVTVSCDNPKCTSTIECGLTPIACNGYDERYLESEIESSGWIVDGEKQYCSEECKNSVEE
jgi:hypothetical protein